MGLLNKISGPLNLQRICHAKNKFTRSKKLAKPKKKTQINLKSEARSMP